MDFPITDLHPANVLEEEERHGALKPLLKVFLDGLFSMGVTDSDTNLCPAVIAGLSRYPLRLSKPPSMKRHGECRCMKLDRVTEAERALKAYAAEADRMQ